MTLGQIELYRPAAKNRIHFLRYKSGVDKSNSRVTPTHIELYPPATKNRIRFLRYNSSVDKSNSQSCTFTYSCFTLFCSLTYLQIKISVRAD